jgi:hypothetical protein
MGSSPLRLMARAAGRIHAELRPSLTDADELPIAAWQRCQRFQRLMGCARARGWTAAERVCRTQLKRSLAALRRELDECERALDAAPTSRAQTLRDVYDDLVAIDAEFDGFRVNLREETVSVVTRPVVLAGVDLGRFEITLDWRRVGAARTSYAVSAMDERCALSDSSLAHPHVRDEQLCEGDGSAAIRSALRGGRLLDFYTIVAQILATYNPQSAYLAIDQWCGISCTDCGSVVDEASCCERCQSDLCGDCQDSCTACGRLACSDCGSSCSHCGERHCRECLGACVDCGNHFCERSLDEERCEACQAAAEAANQAAEETKDPATLPAAAHSTDHPVCVGEAHLPP